MRKAPKYFVTAALAVMTLAGCSNGNNEPYADDKKDNPDFTATIGGAQTRASEQSWEAGDKIGVSGCNRTNVCYITNDGDGSFKINTPGEEIFFQDDSEVVFTAYYPWNELAGGAETIAADTRVQTPQNRFDFLWAQASGKKTAPNVSFNFTHRMAKLLITVKPGDDMSYDEVKTARLSLAGFRYKGTFKVTDGTTAVDNTGYAGEGWVFTDAESKAPVTYNDADNSLTYSLMFLPQLLDEPLTFLADLALPGNKTLNLRAGIDFTAANGEKDGSSAKNEWVAGRQYNISVRLNKTGLTLENCIINPWNQVSGSDDIVVD